MSEMLKQYLLEKLEDHVDDLDFEHDEERDEFEDLMVEQIAIAKSADLIEICNLMEIPRSKVLEYFDDETIKQTMMEIYGDEKYGY